MKVWRSCQYGYASRTALAASSRASWASSSAMAVESSPSRRGVNAGIMQNFFAALLGQSLAPWVLPVIAEQYGWRGLDVFTNCDFRSFCLWQHIEFHLLADEPKRHADELQSDK